MIIQFFSNSMIFPCMDFFMIFHDFQSLWELYIEPPSKSAIATKDLSSGYDAIEMDSGNF